MHVDGLEAVWAAGDATWFPIKQGGLAAQQADVAARSIAARAGAHVPIEAFQPVLRGMLVTGGAPDFLRSSRTDPDADVAAGGRGLWSPSTKVAAHVSRALRRTGSRSRPTHRSSWTSTLRGSRRGRVCASARGIARPRGGRRRCAHRRLQGAIKWLSLVEQLDLVIPSSTSRGAMSGDRNCSPTWRRMPRPSGLIRATQAPRRRSAI